MLNFQKREWIYSIQTAFLAGALTCSAAHVVADVTTPAVGKLLFEENFNALNADLWNTVEGNGCQYGASLCGWGNQELEYYSANNLTIEDVPGEAGNKALVMQARREAVGGSAFTSGKIDSHNKIAVQYGMIEYRMRVPQVGVGLWPAVWMLGTTTQPWPSKGEIDMMEMGHAASAIATTASFMNPKPAGTVDVNSYVGSNAIFYANAACSSGNPTCAAMTAWQTDNAYIAATPLSNRFVTYRTYWTDTQLRFTVVDNNVEYDLYQAPITIGPEAAALRAPFYLLMNLAVGGNFTDALSAGQVTAPLPGKMYLDYVRVYELNGMGKVLLGNQTKPEGGTFGVFTDNTPTSNKLEAGVSSDIYVWNTASVVTGTLPPSEGAKVIAWKYQSPNQWFGGGIDARDVRDMSGFATNGNLKFKIKIPANVAFKVGIKDSYGNESWLNFPANQTTYGLVRNGDWAQATIPVSAIRNSTIALQSMVGMFYIASVDGQLPTAAFEMAIDDVLWDGGGAVASSSSVATSSAVKSSSSVPTSVAPTTSSAAVVSSSKPAPSSVPSSVASSSVASSLYGISQTDSTSVKLYVNTTSWADVHFTVNGGAQSNVRMTQQGGVNTYTVSGLKLGDTVNYSFTYFNVASNYAMDTGVAAYTLKPADSDGDGVSDNLDKCPSTPTGTPVDAAGCPLIAKDTLIQAEEYTAYSDTTIGNTGGVYRTDNVDIEATTDVGAGYNVGWIAQGEWLEYKVALVAGAYNLSARVASAATTGKYTVQIDGVPVGSSSVGNTGGWQAWITQALGRAAIATTGTHTVRVIADGGDFNVNWIKLEVATVASSSVVKSSVPVTSSSSKVPSSSLVPSSIPVSSSSVKSSVPSSVVPSSVAPSSKPAVVSSSSVVSSTPKATDLLLQAEDYTGYNDITTGNAGGQYRNDNVDIEATTDTDGGYNVGWTAAGEWLDFKAPLAAGKYIIKARVASQTGTGKYTVYVDGVAIGVSNAVATGGWQTWQTQTVGHITFNGPATHAVRVQTDSGEYNINWVKFEVDTGVVPSSSAASSTTSAAAGAPVPLYDSTTKLEPVIQFDRGDALVTRIADRARDRHAKENHFQTYDHYLPFYWENRTLTIEIVDYVAKGGNSIRMNVVTQSKLDDKQAENRWFYVGNNTLAEFCGNGVMNAVDFNHYWKEEKFNCRENFRPIKIGDKLEFEVSNFLDANYLPRGRAHYYGTTFLYIVGKGIVPWDVTDMNPFVGGKTFQRDSVPIPESARMGGDTSVSFQASVEPDNYFMQMPTNLSSGNGQAFVLGRRVAHTSFLNGTHDEHEENGVFSEMVGKAGPNYVNTSCMACHERNGRAPVSAVGAPLDKWVFKVSDGNGNPDPYIGRVLQPSHDASLPGEGSVSIASFTEVNGLRKPNFQFERGAPAAYSARLAPQLVGVGLLDAIPEADILANADENDSNGDGISGKAQMVTDPVAGVTRLGRFGYKAVKMSVRHQVAGALNTDMGVMTSMLPKPDCGPSQSGCGNMAGAELSDEHLDNLVKYISLLGVRSQRDYNSPQVIQGKAVFEATGCASCHTQTFKTSAYAPLAELRNQTIHPYTDLLLHDMGPGLADNMGEGRASGAEWRTSPLWGVGLSPCVTGGVKGSVNWDGHSYGITGGESCNPSASYLHDGRARTIDEAIRWHGGEGLKAEQNYERLSASDKDALLKFVNSL